jgi:hypothetical protein
VILDTYTVTSRSHQEAVRRRVMVVKVPGRVLEMYEDQVQPAINHRQP